MRQDRSRFSCLLPAARHIGERRIGREDCQGKGDGEAKREETGTGGSLRCTASRHPRVLLAAWLLAIATSAACGSGTSNPDGPPSGSPDGTPGDTTPDPSWSCTPASSQPLDVDCARVAHIGLAEAAPRLGSGVELALRLEDKNREPLDAATYGRCLRLMHPRDCSEQESVHIDTRPADGALTALLVAPGSSAKSAAQARAVVEAFLRTRPADERIAIYRWGESVLQVSNFSTDRALAERLLARGLVEDAEQLLLPTEAVTRVRDELTELSPGTFAGVRSIVVVAPELALDALPPPSSQHVEIWGLSSLPAAAGASVVVSLEENASAVAGTIAQMISGHVEAGLVQLSWCGSGQSETLLLRPQDGPGGLIVQTPAPLMEEGHLQCSIDALRAPRAYPERVTFVFTNPTQKQDYWDRIEDKSKQTFDVMLRLWENGPVVEAKAKLRGMSSLECQRKGFAVNIRGSDARRLMPGSAADEFYLISMCEDDRYLNHHTAFTIMSRLGLFPLRFRFIELVIDDWHRGLYMLVEKPVDEVRKDNSGVRSIVRRNADLEGEAPEGKYGIVSKQQALDDYHAFLAAVEAAPPGQVLATLESRMDIDQYLRWIALMTLLGNGDYSDEAFFVSTETVDGSLKPTDHYHIFGWDPENLFQECHHDSQYAIVDPHGLLYCAEAQIDHTMFADAGVYARYVSVLESVLDQVTQEIFDAAIDETAALLDHYFVRDDVRSAMIEIIQVNPDAVTYAGIMADVYEGVSEKKAMFAANQRRLREAIARWRATQP